MKRIKVKDNLNLERDRSYSAIINNNETAYKQRLKQKQARKKDKL